MAENIHTYIHTYIEEGILNALVCSAPNLKKLEIRHFGNKPFNWHSKWFLVLSGRLHNSVRHVQKLTAVRAPKWLQFRAGYFEILIHRCGTGSSMRACHTVGPVIDPRLGQVSWVRFFVDFSSPVRQISGSFRPPRSPNIIWPSLSSLIIHYGCQWPEMLTRPKTWNIHT